MFVLCFQSNFPPFTKWKINYTLTKTLAPAITRITRKREIDESLQIKSENTRKTMLQLNAQCTGTNTIANHSNGAKEKENKWKKWREQFATAPAQANKTTACKVNYLYIVSMKQLIKLKMVLSNQTTNVNVKMWHRPSVSEKRVGIRNERWMYWNSRFELHCFIVNAVQRQLNHFPNWWC